MDCSAAVGAEAEAAAEEDAVCAADGAAEDEAGGGIEVEVAAVAGVVYMAEVATEAEADAEAEGGIEAGHEAEGAAAVVEAEVEAETALEDAAGRRHTPRQKLLFSMTISSSCEPERPSGAFSAFMHIALSRCFTRCDIGSNSIRVKKVKANVKRESGTSLDAAQVSWAGSFVQT